MKPINVEERVQKARLLFSEGYNCAQSVLLAYADIWGIEPSFAATIVAPFGGGIGSMWYRQQYGYDGRVYGTGSRPVGQRGQEEKLCTGAGVSRAVSSDKRFYPVSGTTRSGGTGKTCSLREYIRIDQETPMCGICRYSGSPCGRKTSGTFLRH